MRRPLDSLRGRLRDEADCYLLLAAFGAWYLSNLSGALSIDEAIYAESGVGMFAGNPYLNPTHAIAPTAKYATGLSGLVLGGSEAAIRLPAALFGLGTLYVTYRLGRRLRGRWLGLFAAALVGTTYFFAHYSVRMMLDVPLAFFFTGSVLAGLLWLDRDTPLLGLLAGALVVATATTKIYGAFYAAPVVALLVVGTVRRGDLAASLRSLRAPVLGGAALGVAVYAPFAVFPHPPVTNSYGSTVEAVLSVPVFGNYAYILGQAIAKNFLHLGGGHAVEVGGVVYQRPPVWTYLYWFFEHGGVLYAGSLAVSAIAVPVAAVRRRAESLWIGALVFVPLVALSLLTVKFPRYVLPLFPLVVLGGLYNARWLLAGAADRLSGGLDRSQSRGVTSPAAVPVLVVVVVVVASVALTPWAFAPATGTTIREDSGFDDAAAAVVAYAEDTPGEDVVLSYHPSALRYYLGDADVEIENLRPGDAAGSTHAEQLDRIRSGGIDLVVMPTYDPRLRGTDLYRHVRTEGRELVSTTTSPERSQLLVYAVGPGS